MYFGYIKGNSNQQNILDYAELFYMWFKDDLEIIIFFATNCHSNVILEINTRKFNKPIHNYRAILILVYLLNGMYQLLYIYGNFATKAH